MYRLSGLLIQFEQIWQAETPYVELSSCRLADGKAGNAEAVSSLAVAIQKSSGDQIRKETVHGAHGQLRSRCYLLRRESSLRAAEKVQNLQSTLKRRNVVISFRSYSHRNRAKMKVLDYLMKIGFCASEP
jgi:hypothetical protein